MCPVDPDSEDQPRNWLTESEAIGKGPMNSGEGGPQEVDDRRSLTDLEVSDVETEGETLVGTSREDPSLPSAEIPMGCGQRRRKPNPRYLDSA